MVLTIGDCSRSTTGIGARKEDAGENATSIVEVSPHDWYIVLDLLLINFPADLIDDYIGDDSSCAKIIFSRHGYDAWYGWQKKCKGRPLPRLDECFQGDELDRHGSNYLSSAHHMNIAGKWF